MTSSASERSRLHATIDGSVQGVGFRMFVRSSAESFKLTGWVRNTFDGQVEVLAEGKYEDLERLLEKLRQGPRNAFVTQVQQEWQTASGEFASFEIRRTV